MTRYGKSEAEKWVGMTFPRFFVFQCSGFKPRYSVHAAS